VLLAGIAFYVAISALYFFLFKYSLQQYSVEAADRTGLVIHPLKKLSFFISQPLAQAFSFNFLYNMHGIFSQAFYPVMFVIWVITVFYSARGEKLIRKFAFIISVLLMMMLMYVSVLLTHENFASYRTMLCLNLAGTMLLTDVILKLAGSHAIRNWITCTACAIVVAVAWYNFNLNYNRPLEKEYQAVHAFFKRNYDSSKTKIYFVRPPENLFKKLYGVNVFKDEFGLPSTHKDWTPEPLVKQMIFESTGNKDKAKQTSIVNLPHEMRDSIHAEAASLMIDVEQILSQ